MVLRLSAQAQTLNGLLIGCQIFAFDVIQKLTTAGNHFQQTTARRNVVLIGCEVLCKVGNTLGQQGYLVGGATGVLVVDLIIG